MLPGPAARCAAVLQVEEPAQLLRWVLLRCVARAPQGSLLARLVSELRFQQAARQHRPYVLHGALQLDVARRPRPTVSG